MTKILAALAVVCFMVITNANAAEIIQTGACQLTDGKTVEDLSNTLAEWRKVADKAGYKDYKIKIGVPHAASAKDGINRQTVWTVSTSPSMERFGAAYDWWYSSEDGARLAQEFEAICAGTEDYVMHVLDEF